MKRTEIIYELAIKAFPDFSIQESLEESFVAGILNEEVDNNDLKKLRKVVLDNSKSVKTALQIVKEFKMKSLISYFTSILSSLQEALKLASEIDLEKDPEGALDKVKDFFGGKSAKINDALKVVMNLENKSSIALSVVADVLDFVTDNLEGKDIEEGTPIEDISPEALGTSTQELQRAIAERIKKKISKPEGLMGKMSKFFGANDKIAQLEAYLGADVELDPVAISKDIVKLTFGELKGTADKAIENAEASVDSSMDNSTASKIATAEEKDISDQPKVEVGEVYKYTTKKGNETTVKVLEVFDDGDVMVNSSDGKGGFKKNKFRFSGSKLGEKVNSQEAQATEESQEENPEIKSDPASEIEAVSSEIKSRPMSPKDAISKALDDWENSLSPSSKQTLSRKKRNVALRDAIFTGIDKGTAAVKKAVAKAVKDWRAEHEELLIRGKRFAKKNFDSLEQMIPDLAAQVLAQTKENKQRKITVTEIRKFVFKSLDRKFSPNSLLHEKWVKNAGLLKE